MTVNHRPNILVLHIDQQRFDTIAALGAGTIVTPNMDRLVGAGTAFTHAYTSCPLCVPARHDLLTGTSGRHHGYFAHVERPIRDYGLATVPRLLTEAGYQTLAVGKMHFFPPRQSHGYAHMELMEELPTCREDDAYLQYLERVGYGDLCCEHGVRPLFYHTPQESPLPEEHHGTAWVARRAAELLSQPRKRPWFMFVSWVAPHPPLYVPRKYLDMYTDGVPAACPCPDFDHRQTPPSPQQLPAELLNHIRGAYYGAISMIDHHLGGILDALDATGQRERTVILFTSDHGSMLGDRGKFQKHVPFEGSAHIPLIACGPGFESNTRCAAPVTTWDTAATILHAAGIAVPDNHPLVGDDLRRLAAAGSDRTVCFQLGEGRDRYIAATDGRHKFIHWYNGGDEQLFDLRLDPWEQQNLSGDHAHAQVEQHLRQACLRFESEHGPVDRIVDGRFADADYASPPADRYGVYPLWSNWQLPEWMIEYSPRVLGRIEDQMRRCAASPHAHLPRSDEWWEHAVAQWRAIGGNPRFYDEMRSSVSKQRQF